MLNLLPTVEANAPAPQTWQDILKQGAGAWIDGVVSRKYAPTEPRLFTTGPGGTLIPVGSQPDSAYLVGSPENVTGYQLPAAAGAGGLGGTVAVVLVLGVLAVGAFLLLKD